MGNAILAMPVVANNVLYIATKNRLFAIEPAGEQQVTQGARRVPTEE